MRLAFLAAVAGGLWLLARRGKSDRRRVVVAWEDGSELELPSGTSERERLVSVAERVLA